MLLLLCFVLFWYFHDHRTQNRNQRIMKSAGAQVFFLELVQQKRKQKATSEVSVSFFFILTKIFVLMVYVLNNQGKYA